ncbi:MAG: sacsin N-terminal ATP-binding-like domain-containing protein, partial [Verrucomicrobiia bacterium]
MQNSDDARATDVIVQLGEDTVYVADNGDGLKPESISALCGTDFSDKTNSTIGRKGVGFKSVYGLTQNPQLITVKKGGIEFNPERTKEWLSENGLNNGHVPYQWVPFFISWNDALIQDPRLSDFADYMTVIRLPKLSSEIKKVEELLDNLPPHTLLTFRHIRKITAPKFGISVNGSDGIFSLKDSRGLVPIEWRIAKHIERPPEHLLEGLGESDRRAISMDGVSFLIGAPLNNGCVVPTEHYLPVHVFYPTEQTGPVRLLLHSEFLVKSDRTAIIPIDSSPFNMWVADRLAEYICKFVNDSYLPDKPSANVALLLPFGDRESHTVANDLWRRIAEKARQVLRLADTEAQQRLTISEARLIGVTTRSDLARGILEKTELRNQLLHSAFDEDNEAFKAVSALGCEEIKDKDLIECITEYADALSEDTQWIWDCWEWLAEWVAQKPYGDDHNNRIKDVQTLPIIPVSGRLVKPSDLEACIVTWKSDTEVGILPDWLPLTFVDDWFRDKIKAITDNEHPIKKLCKEIRIVEPSADVIQNAVGLAIKRFWKDKQGDPGRFLEFIFKQDWFKDSNKAPDSLQRCPVPISQSVQDEQWAEARECYFGKEWENDVLEQLYDGITGVKWVSHCDVIPNNNPQSRSVLEWLGVAYCPRIIIRKNVCVRDLKEENKQEKEYFETSRCYGRSVERIETLSDLDFLNVKCLTPEKGALLVRLVAKHWQTYYKIYKMTTVWGATKREIYLRPWEVKAKWFWEICEQLRVPIKGGNYQDIPITKLWLLDERTDSTISELLPVIDIDAFKDDKATVRDWLVYTVELRTRIGQLTKEEWEDILSNQIPGIVPVEKLESNEKLRHKVTGWYEECLETVAVQNNLWENCFKSCKLLCRRGEKWEYTIDRSSLYLNDDNDFASELKDEIWLFHISPRLTNNAKKYFSIQLLSENIKVGFNNDISTSPLQGELKEKLNASIPYIWTWRISQTKDGKDNLLKRLKNLNVHVVPDLEITLSLGKITKSGVKRRWHISNDSIYLHKDHVNESELAQALANFLGVRSEADFYENLLRCNDDEQRTKKLLSKNITEEQLKKCLSEFSQQDTNIGNTDGNGQNSGNNVHITKGKKPGPPNGPGVGNPPGTQNKKEDQPKDPLKLKDPNSTPYELRNVDKVIYGSGGSGGGYGGGGISTGCQNNSLSEEEKKKLEQTAREFAKKALEKEGYTSLMDMPSNNPGYDILAEKENEK